MIASFLLRSSTLLGLSLSIVHTCHHIVQESISSLSSLTILNHFWGMYFSKWQVLGDFAPMAHHWQWPLLSSWSCPVFFKDLRSLRDLHATYNTLCLATFSQPTFFVYKHFCFQRLSTLYRQWLALRYRGALRVSLSNEHWATAVELKHQRFPKLLSTMC